MLYFEVDSDPGMTKTYDPRSSHNIDQGPEFIAMLLPVVLPSFVNVAMADGVQGGRIKPRQKYVEGIADQTL